MFLTNINIYTKVYLKFLLLSHFSDADWTDTNCLCMILVLRDAM